MKNSGRVDRPAIGIMIMNLSGKRNRAKIEKKYPDTYIPNTYGLFIDKDGDMPEELMPYDTIIGINDVMVNDGLTFSDELAKYEIGDMISLTIIRKSKFMKVKVPLKLLPINEEDLYNTQTFGP